MTARKPADEAQPDTAPVPGAPSESPVTLDEFCRELSLSGHGPEILGGFHGHMTRQRRIRDYRDGFRRAFDAYRVQPISE